MKTREIAYWCLEDGYDFGDCIPSKHDEKYLNALEETELWQVMSFMHESAFGESGNTTHPGLYDRLEQYPNYTDFLRQAHAIRCWIHTVKNLEPPYISRLPQPCNESPPLQPN